MNSVDLLNAWGASWAAFMARAIVDSSVLLVVATLVWIPLRSRMSAQFAHGLFLLVLLKLVVPIAVTWPAWMSAPALRQEAARFSAWAIAGDEAFPAVVIEPADDPILVEVPAPEPIIAAAVAPLPARERSDEPKSSGKPERIARPALSLSAMLMMAWASTATLLLLRFLRVFIGTQRLLRDAVPVCPGWLPVDLDGLRRAAKVRLVVRWAISPKVSSPAVGGLIRPTVVLPPDLQEGLTPKQLTWVLLHELAHVRRGDLWIVTAQRLVQAVFFFHPGVHLANWIIDQLREYACDDAALSASQASRHDCGEGFLTVVGRSVAGATPTHAAALGLFESRMLIRRRLLRILDSRRTVYDRLSPRAAGLLLAMGAVVLPYGHARDASAKITGARSERTTLAKDEPRLYAPGATFLHDDREESAGQPRRSVLCVAYSPDGRWIASAGEDAVVVIRDSMTLSVKSRLVGHNDAVACVAFHPSSAIVATAGYDRTIRLWNLETGKQFDTLQGHENWIFALAFSPDGTTLASAGSDRTVRLWDVAGRRQRAILTGHESAIRAIAFSPDGATLVSAGADRLAMTWELKTLAARSTLQGHRGTIRALAFAPDGKTIATAGEDGEIKLWDPKTGRERATLTGHNDMIFSIAYSPGGTTLASAGLDGVLKLWDPKTGRERATLTCGGSGILSLAIAPGARQIATAAYDGGVTLLDPAAPNLPAAAALDAPDEVFGVAFAPDGKRLFATSKVDVVTVYDPVAALVVDKELPGGGSSIAVSPDGKTLATGGWDGKIRLMDVASRRHLSTLTANLKGVRSVAFSPDGKTIAAAGQDGSVNILKIATSENVKTFARRLLPATSVAFSPDGKVLAVATGDWKTKVPGVVTLFDVKTGEELRELHGHALTVSAVAFSPDGKTLASSGADGVIALWDPTTGTKRTTMSHSDAKAVAFSADSRFVASGHYGGDVVLWDAATGRKLATLKGHGDLVFSVAFSPDGKTLASGSKDATVRLWNLGARKVAPRCSVKGEVGCLGPIAISPDGATLATAAVSYDMPGDIVLIDAATYRIRTTLQGHERGVASLAYSPDGRLLASSSWDLTIRLWDAGTGESKGEFAVTEDVTRIAFSPDGTILASAGEDKLLTLWNVDDGSEITRIDDFQGALCALAFSPDGRLIATGGGRDGSNSSFGEVKIFDLNSHSEVASLTGHTASVRSLAFSGDGRTLATGGMDSTVRLWDVSTASAKLSLGGFPSCVQALVFSGDGAVLAISGRGDGTVSLFDTATGGELARLVGHTRNVLGMAFSDDDRTLTTGSLDATIKLWDVPSHQRNLSR